MKESFWGLVWTSFLKVKGVPSIIIVVILPLILWLLHTNINVPMWLTLPIVLFCVLWIFVLGNIAYEGFKLRKRSLPKIISAKKPSSQIPIVVSCLLEPSELFSHDVAVSFYYIDDDKFEQLIGIGAVEIIREDGIIQIVMTYPVSGHEETIERLTQNNAAVLEKIRVKPYIPKAYLNM